MNGSNILVVGLAYKPDVDDMRESPTFHIMDLLEKYGAEVSYYDEYIPKIKPTREHDHWTGTQSIHWDEETIKQFDAALIITNHSHINYKELRDWSSIIVDTRNAMKGIRERHKDQIWKA